MKRKIPKYILILFIVLVSALASTKVQAGGTFTLSPLAPSTCARVDLSFIAMPGSGIPVSYLWTGTGATYLNFTNIMNPVFNCTLSTGGSFTLTCKVTYADLSEYTQSTVITVKALPVVAITPSDTNICEGGTAHLCASGGSAYLWSVAGTAGSFSNTPCVNVSPADTAFYTAMIIDGATFCVNYANATVNILHKPDPFAGPDATICATSSYAFSGATVHYYSHWDWTSTGTGSFTPGSHDVLNPTYNPSAADIAAGNVTLTITGDVIHPCYVNTDNMVLTINPPPTANAGIDNTICSNLTYTFDGSVSATNATSTQWSTDGDGSFDDPNVLGATYSPGANDMSGLPKIIHLTLTSTGLLGCGTAVSTMNLTLKQAPIISMASTDVSCFGKNDGHGTATVVAGLPAYTYDWSHDAANHTLLTGNVGPGTYTITVSSLANGCTATADAIISEPADITFAPVIQNVQCKSANDGSITLNAGGGDGGPYSYNWSPAKPNSDVVGPLSANTYKVTVTDGSGCTNSTTIVITEPAALTVGNVITPVNCNTGANGGIQLFVGGGTTAYNYNWNPAEPNSAHITGLAAGSYDVTVTDAQNCSIVKSYTVTSPAPIVVTPTPTNVTCFGLSNGKVTLVVSGGVPAYSYLWSSGDISKNIAGKTAALTVGTTYTVTVTDFQGCTQTASQILTEPDVLIASAIVSPVDCNGNNNGSMTISQSGGTPAYTYTWSPGGVLGISRTNLIPGAYTVTVSDTKGCKTIVNGTITEPPSLISTPTLEKDISCNGGNDGALNTSSSGGTLPYTYVWSPNLGNGANLSTLTAGTYDLTLTDGNNCSVTYSKTLTEPPIINIVPTVTDATCNGVPDGSITLVVSGGQGGFTYQWSSGELTKDISGKAIGSYTITVTDGNGCTNVSTSTINEPSSVSALLTPTNIDCNGNNNGKISIAPFGGTPGYTYTWAPGGVLGASRTNLIPGIYTITVADAHGCKTIVGATLSEPATLNVTNALLQHVFCNGGSDGKIHANVTGGTGPFTYTWNPNADITANADNLSIGTYNLTVTDANSCTAVLTNTLTQPLPMVVTPSITDASCSGKNDGSISLLVTGGKTAYTYNWSSGELISSISNKLAGSYSITVTDANLCTIAKNYAINEPTLLNAIANVNNVNCKGKNNGSITIIPSGGTPGYTYHWNPGGALPSVMNNLVPGNYDITVTDNLGCTTLVSTTVTEPALPLTITNIVTMPVSCHNGTDGAIHNTISGGTAGYTYVWNPNNGVTSDLDNQSPGTYKITVTDTKSCTATQTFTITNPSGLSFAQVVNQVSCNGGNNGKITLAISGGKKIPVVNYDYLWSDGETTSVIQNLTTGSYTVTVTDYNACTASKTYTLTAPNALTATETHTDVLCFGDNNGTADITPVGGVGPFTYTWDDGHAISNPTDLVANTYNITVTDNNNCTSPQLTLTITEPVSLSVTHIWTDAFPCSTATGDATLSVSDGTPPYSYLWDNGQTTVKAINLSSGSYTVVITDNNGCSIPDVVDIGDSGGPLATIFGVSHVSCNGKSDGAMSAVGSGTTPPYNYFWNTSPITNAASISGLTAKTYSVTVVDLNGCKGVNSLAITEPLLLKLNTSNTEISCNGANDATLTAIGVDGTPAYTYAWTGGGAFSSPKTNLIPNNYTITVTDTHNCTASTTIQITEPLLLTTTASITNLSCNLSGDGAITANPAGGTSPFNYTWNPAIGVTATISNLTTGAYDITVTDARNCSTLATFNVTEPLVLTASLTPTPELCKNGGNGSITANINGGTGTYHYVWDSGDLTQTISNKPIGTYTVSVTDDNNCPVTGSATITEPGDLSVTINKTDVKCNGANNGTINIVASGGTGAITYIWQHTGSGVSSLSNLAPGNYFLSVTDANSCQKQFTIVITEPNALVVSITPVSPSACNLNDGSATAGIVGGTAPYSYLWDNFQNTQTITNISAGPYTVTVTDNNNCKSIGNTNVNDGNGPSVTIVLAKDIDCNGANSGLINITVSGGTPNPGNTYNYLWSNGAITQNLTNLVANNYCVTVTDKVGCKSFACSTLTESPAITISGIVTHELCNNGTNASIVASAVGGGGAYSYKWSNGILVNTATTLIAIPYTVTVTDNLLCTATKSFTITQPTKITLTPSSTQPSACGVSDGSASIAASNGTPPYTYLWQDNSTGTSIANLAAGGYGITVTDNNACTLTSIVNIIDKVHPTVIITPVKSITCFGANDGKLFAVPSGGLMPYTYTWNNGNSTQTNDNLIPGHYSIIVSDGNNCVGSANADITEPALLTVKVNAITNVLCDQSATGSISTDALGGTSTYSYLWDNGASTKNINNLTNGNFTITITDINSCTATQTIAITAPSPIVMLPDYIPTSACGTSDGCAFVNASGGVSPYHFVWNVPSTVDNDTLCGLPVSDYVVTLTDANACKSVIHSPVNAFNSLIIKFTYPVKENCNGDALAQINAVATHGVYPLTYTWQTALGVKINDSTLANLPAGNYTLNVVDVNGCKGSDVAVITEPLKLTVFNSSTTNVGCNGGNDGALIVTGKDGTAPYTYLWNDGTTNAIIGNLTKNNYQVTVTDANLCTATSSLAITEPLDLKITMSNNATTVCKASDGTASVTVTAGTGSAPFDYYWSCVPHQFISIASNLVAGSYTVTVTDKNGCSKVGNTTVNDGNGPTATISGNTSSTCFNSNDGTATITATGGNGGYVYKWNDPSNQTSAKAIGLSAATYNVTVTDALGCVGVGLVVIGQPQNLISNITPTAISCNGNNDGKVSVAPTGGNAGGYFYSWNNFASTPTISSLSAAMYHITITDTKGCTRIDSAAVIEPSSISAITSSTDPLVCGQKNGTATVVPMGGTPAYTYKWLTVPVQTLATATNIGAGIVKVVIKDQANCVDTILVAVSDPHAPKFNVVASDVDCFGNSTGCGSVVPDSLGVYNYIWSNNKFIDQSNNCAFPKGTQWIQMKDINNCSSFKTFVINQPADIILSYLVTDVKCNGDNTGSIKLNVIGGISPYIFKWSDNSTTQDISAVPATIYNILVTDKNSCPKSTNITITEPGKLLAPITWNDITCNSACDGNSTVTPSGGVPPYSYHWTDNQNTNNAKSLCPGNYQVTVTDANNCNPGILPQVTITEPSQLTLSYSNNTSILCFGDKNGSVTAVAAGGIPPYNYLWSDGQTTISAINLGATPSINVTVTDAHNCNLKAFPIATILGPTKALDLAITADSVTCNGFSTGQATVVPTLGWGAPYTFSWSNGGLTSIISSIPAGTYNVNVTDAGGCVKNAPITVYEPAPLTLSLIPDSVLCKGGATGKDNATALGGTKSYNFVWNTVPAGAPVSLNALASNLATGDYSCTVTDKHGCTAITANKVPEPNFALTGMIITTKTVSCFNGNDGQLTVIPGGGTGKAYKYIWNDGKAQTTALATNLISANYIVTISDYHNCTFTSPAFLLTQPAKALTLLPSPSIKNDTCHGGSNGAITVVPDGGTPAYAFNWSNGEALANATNLSAGNYTCTVTDSKNCTSTTTYTVSQPANWSINAPITNVDCYNYNTGAVIIQSVTGNTGGYSYLWDDNSNANQIGLRKAGIYTVTITDTKNCDTIIHYTITQKHLTTDFTLSPPKCFGDANGSIVAIASNGNAPYKYRWSHNPNYNTNKIDTLVEGTYNLTITDSKNCFLDTVTLLKDPDLLTVNAGKDQVIGWGERGQFDAISNYVGANFSWTPTSYLDLPLTATPICTPNDNITYTVKVENSNGCIATDTLKVKVIKKVVFGNTITPNGDHYNDTWVIRDIEYFPEAFVQIFNRWGAVIYESKGHYQEFEGKYHGEELPVGVYFYIIKLNDTAEPVSGYINVFR